MVLFYTCRCVIVCRMSGPFFLQDLWHYLKVRKKYWLLPIIIMLLLLGLLIVFTEGTAISPFIYVLF